LLITIETREPVLFLPGLILGIAGMVGVQVGTRVLPNLSNHLISRIFNIFLVTMAVFNFYKAWVLVIG